MKKFVKLISLALCAVLCMSIVLSACYAIHNSDHTCIGEECRICQIVTAQKENLRAMRACFFSSIIPIVFVHLSSLPDSFVGKLKNKQTLVAYKVKLTA